MRPALLIFALAIAANSAPPGANAPALELSAFDVELARAEEAQKASPLDPAAKEAFVRERRARLGTLYAEVPPTPANQGLYARLLARLGGSKEALSGLRQSLETMPGEPNILLAQGQIQLQDKDYPAALASAEQLLKQDPPASPEMRDQALAVKRASQGRVKSSVTNTASSGLSTIDTVGGVQSHNLYTITKQAGKRVLSDTIVPSIPKANPASGSRIGTIATMALASLSGLLLFMGLGSSALEEKFPNIRRNMGLGVVVGGTIIAGSVAVVEGGPLLMRNAASLMSRANPTVPSAVKAGVESMQGVPDKTAPALPQNALQGARLSEHLRQLQRYARMGLKY